MTSNLGSQAIMELTGEEASQHEITNQVMDILKQQFLPEFINRVDEVIVFQPLGRDEIRKIVDLQLVQLDKQLQLNGYGLSVTDKAKELLAEEGYDPNYGARPLKRVIQKRLQNALANEILSGHFEEGVTIHVDAVRDSFVFSTEE